MSSGGEPPSFANTGRLTKFYDQSNLDDISELQVLYPIVQLRSTGSESCMAERGPPPRPPADPDDELLPDGIELDLPPNGAPNGRPNGGANGRPNARPNGGPNGGNNLEIVLPGQPPLPPVQVFGDARARGLLGGPNGARASTSSSGEGNSSDPNTSGTTTSSLESGPPYNRLHDPRFPDLFDNFLSVELVTKPLNRRPFRVNYVVTPQSWISIISTQIIQVLHLGGQVRVQHEGPCAGMQYIILRVSFRRSAYDKFFLTEGPADFRMGSNLARALCVDYNILPHIEHTLPLGYNG